MNEYSILDTVVVGVDTHKRSHTAVMVDPLHQEQGQYVIPNTDDGISTFLNQIVNQVPTKKIVFALEDTESNGSRLSRYLVEQNQTVYAVPSTLTERERKRSPHAEKTDYLDAKRVATIYMTQKDLVNEVMITENTEFAKEVKVLIADRNDMVSESAKIKNQLHALVYQRFAEKSEKVSKFSIFCKKGIRDWLEHLSQFDDYLSLRIASKFKRLQLINEELKVVDTRLDELTQTNEDMRLLRTIPGCGAVLSAMIYSEIKDIKRFRSASALARYCGIAPRRHASSSNSKHYTDRRGNRKLNYALYQLALSQISASGTPVGQTYYAKKRKEGKSKLHALRCLRRRMVNVIYYVLTKREEYMVLGD